MAVKIGDGYIEIEPRLSGRFETLAGNQVRQATQRAVDRPEVSQIVSSSLSKRFNEGMDKIDLKSNSKFGIAVQKVISDDFQRGLDGLKLAQKLNAKLDKDLSKARVKTSVDVQGDLSPNQTGLAGLGAKLGEKLQGELGRSRAKTSVTVDGDLSRELPGLQHLAQKLGLKLQADLGKSKAQTTVSIDGDLDKAQQFTRVIQQLGTKLSSDLARSKAKTEVSVDAEMDSQQQFTKLIQQMGAKLQSDLSRSKAKTSVSVDAEMDPAQRFAALVQQLNTKLQSDLAKSRAKTTVTVDAEMDSRQQFAALISKLNAKLQSDLGKSKTKTTVNVDADLDPATRFTQLISRLNTKLQSDLARSKAKTTVSVDADMDPAQQFTVLVAKLNTQLQKDLSKSKAKTTVAIDADMDPQQQFAQLLRSVNSKIQSEFSAANNRVKTKIYVDATPDEESLKSSVSRISDGINRHSVSIGPSAKPSMIRAGAQVADAFTEAVGETISRVPASTYVRVLATPVGAGLAAAIGLAAATVVIPLVGAALTAAVGGSFLAVGLAAAIKNPGVKSALDELKSRFSTAFNEAGKSIVGPLTETVTVFANLIEKKIGGQLVATVARMAPVLSKLTEGAAQALHLLMPSLDKLAELSIPVFDEIAIGLPKLAFAFGQLVKQIEPVKEELALAMRVTIDFVAQLIVYSGTAIRVFGEIFGVLHDVGQAIEDGLITSWGGVTEALATVGRGLNNVVQAALGVAKVLKIPVPPELKQMADAIDADTKAFSELAKGIKPTTDELKGLNPELTQFKSKADLAAAAAAGNEDAIKKLAGQEAELAKQAKAATDEFTKQQDAFRGGIDDVEGYERAVLNMTRQLSSNSAGLKINSEDTLENRAAVLDNRDAIQAVIQKSQERYKTDIEGKVPMDEALARHNHRIEALKTEAEKSGLTKDQVQNLIKEYGQVPTDVITIMQIQGASYTDVSKKMRDLLIMQKAGIEGIDPKDAAKRVDAAIYDSGRLAAGKKADGGLIRGPGGPTDDKAGLFRLSDYEFVHKADAVKHYGVDFMEKINNQTYVPSPSPERARHPFLSPPEKFKGYAKGGLVYGKSRPGNVAGRVMSGRVPRQPASQKQMPFKFDLSKFMIPTLAGPGDRGTGGPSIDKIIGLAKSSGIPHQVGSTYRPGSRAASGNLDYHASKRAVDFPGFNQDKFAQFWENMAGNLLELIHRSNKKDYGYSNGTPYRKGSNNQLLNEHKNHIHVAMNGDAGSPTRGGNFTGGKTNGMAPGAIRDANKLPGAARGWLATAASRRGVADWQMPLQSLAWRESGGNPLARSFSSNGRWGYAIGLIQLLESTFAAYRDKSLPNSRTDPVANASAGINWIKSRYGSIWRLGHAVGENPAPGGYDHGGMLGADGLIQNITGEPEMVLNPSQGAALTKQIEGTGNKIINLTLDLGHGIKEVVGIEIDNNDEAKIMPMTALRR